MQKPPTHRYKNAGRGYSRNVTGKVEQGIEMSSTTKIKLFYNIINCLDSYIIHAAVYKNHLHTDTRMLAEDTAEMLKEKLKKGKVLK
jgi:hypothetical protein